MERALALREGFKLMLDLPKSPSKRGQEPPGVYEPAETESESDWMWSVGFPPPKKKKLNERASEMKRALIDEALRRAGGKRVTAAALLGTTRHDLKRQMKTLGYFEPE